jgi:hypothetical protein
MVGVAFAIEVALGNHRFAIQAKCLCIGHSLRAC